MKKILKRDVIVITILVLLSIYLLMDVKINFDVEINMSNLKNTIVSLIPIFLSVYLYWSKEVQ